MSKKITTTLIVLFAAISFSSCVKTFDCTCKLDDGQGFSASESYPTIGTKKVAQAACDETKATMEAAYGEPANCTLN